MSENLKSKTVKSTRKQMDMLVDYMACHSNFAAAAEFNGPLGPKNHEKQWPATENSVLRASTLSDQCARNFLRLKLHRPGVQCSRSASSLFANRAADVNVNRLSGLGQHSSASVSPVARELSPVACRARSDRAFNNRFLEESAQQPTQSTSELQLPLPRLRLFERNNEQTGEVVQELASAELSDDDVEMTGVTAPPLELHNEEQNEDRETHTPEISLEEEIVEIEGGGGEEEGEVGVVAERGELGADAQAHSHHTTDAHDGPTQPENAPVNVASENPSRHGVKRKRDALDNEPTTVKEFNQRMLRVLECPVCLEWMEPPISQCRRGHLICDRCRARIAACPVCRCAFSSVRNRAMEAVADMLRYPCRHGCGREVRLRRRGPHEASCPSRRYRCVSPACLAAAPMPRDQLALHLQNQHMSMLKFGQKHRIVMKVHSELRENYVVMALRELFHLRLHVDVRNWGLNVHVAYIGPKKRAATYIYEVTVVGEHDSRRMTYARATHCDLEDPITNTPVPCSTVFRHDCFALSLDQALHFVRSGPQSDKCLNLDIEIKRSSATERTDSDS